MRANVLAQTDS